VAGVAVTWTGSPPGQASLTDTFPEIVIVPPWGAVTAAASPAAPAAEPDIPTPSTESAISASTGRVALGRGTGDRHILVASSR
jgi:hypothetical protein